MFRRLSTLDSSKDVRIQPPGGPVAKINEKVMAMVEEQLAKTPDISSRDLYAKAKSTVSSIGRLSLRQFNARYPLQVKRRKSSARRRPKGAAAKPATGRSVRKGLDSNRDAVRKILLDFAGDLSGAEERKDLVRVLANVDGYVNRVIRAAR
jgi:hypothetical protein